MMDTYLSNQTSQNEMQAAKPLTWTQFANSVSNNIYCYRKHSSIQHHKQISLLLFIAMYLFNFTWLT